MVELVRRHRCPLMQRNHPGLKTGLVFPSKAGTRPFGSRSTPGTGRGKTDLFRKVENDLLRLEAAAPESKEAQYAAFDFFVGASHLADWVHHSTGEQRSALRSYPDGALVTQVANGAKHFSLNRDTHTVRDTSFKDGAFSAKAFSAKAFSVPRLVVVLETGVVEDVIVVAKRVLAHWKGYLGIS